MDRTHIDTYLSQADEPKAWIAGLTRDQLNSHPVPGTWSIQQVVLHTLDSDLVATDRMKRIIAMDLPLLMNYDESRYAGLLFYDKRDASKACDLFASNRRHTAELLSMLPDDAFERAGVHSVRGLVTLSQLVEDYVEHVVHHRKFIIDKRQALGKPPGT
ncbi:MAG: DinB family protein [Phycisphaeraceae bacterium]|nr:DinB family protein [Phycisphaeraceae bacterium]